MSSGSSATSLESVKGAKKELTDFLKKIQTEPSDILEQEAKTLKKEIQQETPYKSGKLYRSIRVKVARDRRRPGINVSASANENGYNYAGIQHENTKFRHPGGGKAFYIRDPFLRCTERIRKRMVNIKL